MFMVILDSKTFWILYICDRKIASKKKSVFIITLKQNVTGPSIFVITTSNLEKNLEQF